MSIADMIAKFEEWNNSANETVHNFVETANKALGLIQKLPLPGLQALIEIVKTVLKGVEQVVKYLHDLVDFIIQDLKSAQKLDDTGNDLTQRVAVPVAGVSQGFLSQLEGRKERFWEGDGAKAYTEHTDLQGQACEELSNAYQTLATALHDAYDGCMVFAGAMAVAAGTFIAGVAAAAASLIPPATPAAPAVWAAVVAVLKAALAAAVAAVSAWFLKLHPQLRKAQEGLDNASLNGGKTVFYNGNWPTLTLY